MQLKFKRYTGSKGMLIKATTYCVEAIAHPGPAEQASINTHDRARQPFYFNLDELDLATPINQPTFADFTRGLRLECNTLDGALRAESMIANACQDLLATLEILATFDGREHVVEVKAGSVEVVAVG